MKMINCWIILLFVFLDCILSNETPFMKQTTVCCVDLRRNFHPINVKVYWWTIRNRCHQIVSDKSCPDLNGKTLQEYLEEEICCEEMSWGTFTSYNRYKRKNCPYWQRMEDVDVSIVSDSLCDSKGDL